MTSVARFQDVSSGEFPALPGGNAYDLLFTVLTERIADLELAADAQGWLPLAGHGEDDFTRDGLGRIVERARLMALKDPLVGRGIEVQVDYVFGQGVNVKCSDSRVQDLVNAFWDDPKNRLELTSDEALAAKETTLMVAGNLFLALFVNPSNGKVRVRSIPFAQILDIAFNPQDGREPWYYKRVWAERTYSPDAREPQIQEKVAWYPDWRFAPKNPPARIATDTLVDTPLVHVKVGGLEDQKFGVPMVYAALDWAAAYKSFLTDWATLTKALSKFAWKATVKGGQDKVSALAAALARNPENPDEPNTNRRTPGGIWTQNEQVDLSAMPKTGATISSEDGRRLLLMTAAAFGIPETFFGDADVGNHATAKTLDRPTELKFRRRQGHWTSILGDLFQYCLDRGLEAPGGAFVRGKFEDAPDDDPMDQGRWVLDPPDPGPGQEVLDEGDRTIDVSFPPILEPDVAGQVGAVIDAVTLKGSQLNDVIITPQQASRLILEAMGVDEVDEWLADIFPVDDDGTPKLRDDQVRREELQAKADATKLAIAGRGLPEGEGGPGGPPGGPREAAEAFSEAVRELVTYVETKLSS